MVVKLCNVVSCGYATITLSHRAATFSTNWQIYWLKVLTLISSKNNTLFSFQREMSTEDMQAAFTTDQEQLRLALLGIDRIYQIFERGWSFEPDVEYRTVVYEQRLNHFFLLS